MGSVPSGPFASYLYGGAAKLTAGYANPVVGRGADNVTDHVCEDGANGGVRCNLSGSIGGPLTRW
ncbi:hypothetical protein ACFYOD_38960 [Streptomyces sp. NPDC006703]|uniref:hypothetical protein n=1 Tax=Streptomyces sp. NPDC006703 TaxID=3364759 RepID=UPI003697F704